MSRYEAHSVYAAPADNPLVDDSELFVASIPPRFVRVAGLGLVVMGLVLAYFAFLRGFIAGEVNGSRTVIVYGGTFVLGVVHLLLALPLASGRAWAAVVALALTPLAMLACAAILLGGWFAGLFGVCLALVNLVLFPMTIPACLRVARARRELARRHAAEVATLDD